MWTVTPGMGWPTVPYRVRPGGLAVAAAVDSVIAELAGLLERGDVLVDGGNSHYHDDIRRAKTLAKRGIHYLDVGTSGGVWGLERGYCQMIGGETEPVKRLDPSTVLVEPGQSVEFLPPFAGG